MLEPVIIHENILNKLFSDYFKVEAESVRPISAHASTRKYFLLEGKEKQIIGVYGPTLPENQAFFHIQKALSEKGIPVPELLKVDASGFYYLQSYHGPTDVFTCVETVTSPLDILKKSIEVLVSMHSQTRTGFDFSLCYPHPKFDTNEVKREFWAFEHKYLSNKGIKLAEEYFKRDIEFVDSIIDEIPTEDYGFMHRDFQTRNLLIDKNGNITVIDFQGGREGPLYYDLASFIYSPESPHAHRHQDELIDFYRELALDARDRDYFMKFFLVLSLVRLLHTLGVYGVVGIEQNSEFFKKNIPAAEQYLIEVLSKLKSEFNVEFPGLSGLYSSSL